MGKISHEPEDIHDGEWGMNRCQVVIGSTGLNCWTMTWPTTGSQSVHSLQSEETDVEIFNSVTTPPVPFFPLKCNGRFLPIEMQWKYSSHWNAMEIFFPLKCIGKQRKQVWEEWTWVVTNSNPVSFLLNLPTILCHWLHSLALIQLGMKHTQSSGPGSPVIEHRIEFQCTSNFGMMNKSCHLPSQRFVLWFSDWFLF